VFVTLTVTSNHYSELGHFGFKLAITNVANTTVNDRVYSVLSPTIITNPVPQHISYPTNNARSYTPNTIQATLIAPFTKTPFNLTLTYLQTETQHDNLFVYLLDGNSTRSSFQQVSTNTTK